MPTSAHDHESWLRLSLATLPTARAREILRHFNGPQALLDAAISEPQALEEQHKISKRAIEKLQLAARKDVSEPLEAMRTHAISVVTETEYPPLLGEIGDDAPAWLFARGALVPSDSHCIAIVGTRNVTEYGRGLAHRFALEFARAGWTVVSGLARGIDTAAHRGALDGGGRTIAVTGCGLDMVYPSENRDLMLEIERNGAVLSEWAPGTPPASWHFPARNRLVSGLSCAVVVVEAQAKSGALISANFAGEHGRQVFGVPGNVHKPQSFGPHQLIQEGAMLAQSADDVLQYLADSFNAPGQNLVGDENELTEIEENASIKGAEPAPTISRRLNTSQSALSQTDTSSKAKVKAPPAKPAGPRADLAPDENKVWLALDVEPRHMDDIAEDAALPPSATNAALVMLELKGVAKRLPGNLFVKVV